jgi:hypothetical protein
MRAFVFPSLFLLGSVLGVTAAPAPLDFNRDIQPILSDNCYQCHGQDANKREAELRLDRKEGLYRTKDDITVVKPGDAKGSELVVRIFTTDKDDIMPPPKSHRSLTAAQKAALKRWVEEGAPWGEHWAFRKPQRPALPAGASSAQAIDAFVRARLTAEGLQPSAPAPKGQLLRRVTLDLTGVPPTPEELDDFLADNSPQAYEKVVDRLLASPRYGERWCWDWLDAARYADTNGFQGDPERTMWPWRDWVTQALNDNLPFDKFTIWQLAGDLLPDATPEQKLATGFHRNHMMNGEGGRISEESRVENVFDRVETTATVWLGLTIQCTKCHDHKFDPLTQKDYFAFYDFFNQTSETGDGRGGQAAPAMDRSTPEELARQKKADAALLAVAAEVESFETTKFPRAEGQPLSASEASNLPGNLGKYIGGTEPAKRGVDALAEAIAYFKERDPEYTKMLEKQLKSVRDRDAAAKSVTKVMVMDTLPKPRETFILVKGAYDKKTDVKVESGTPAMLPAMTPEEPRSRLGLAQWLVARDNPLTARVTVNRMWQSFFGTGLVKTAEDFGLQGEKPSHPELLDWLAVEFMERGWDVKAMHKLMVMSDTYRQSSNATPALFERDPENRLLARGPRYRLPAWMIRDQALAASGLLVEKPGGPSVMSYQPEGIWEEATFGKKTYKQDHGDALHRRSLYTFWLRIVGPPMFFDSASRQTCSVRTARTNTPLHALATLNDVTYTEAARMMAERVLHTNGANDGVMIDAAFRLVSARTPSEKERAVLQERLMKLRAAYEAEPEAAKQLASAGEAPRDEKLAPVEHAAWSGLCLMLLNLDEALTKN